MYAALPPYLTLHFVQEAVFTVRTLCPQGHNAATLLVAGLHSDANGDDY